METFLIYLVGVLLLSLLGLVAAFNFARYRFKGDKTLLIITIFAAMFVLQAVGTVFFFRPADAVTDPFMSAF